MTGCFLYRLLLFLHVEFLIIYCECAC